MSRYHKTLGIVGGMGPLATAHFYQRLIHTVNAEHDQEHPRVLIDSNPSIPDRTLALAGKGPSPAPAIIKSAQNLKKIGSHILAIPCITAHAYFKEISKSVDIPIIHILEESAEYYRSHFSEKRIGVAATAGTIHSRLLENYFETDKLVYPDEETIEKWIMGAIYGKTGVKGGNLTDSVRLLDTACEKLIDNGADILIAGCTEISIIIHQIKTQKPVLDPIEVLAKACLVRIQEY